MDTVYRKQREISGSFEHPFVVFSDSAIKTWDHWPPEVVEVLQRWNHDKTHKLRFEYLGEPFICPDCHRMIDVGDDTACVLDHAATCDDCIIARVRKYGNRGRPETELEAAKRVQADLERKLGRMKHNARTEHEYVSALKQRAKAVVDAYGEASISDEEGLLMTVNPAAMRALWAGVDEAVEALDLAIHGRDA